MTWVSVSSTKRIAELRPITKYDTANLSTITRIMRHEYDLGSVERALQGIWRRIPRHL
jgi:hypothetical protein